MESIIMTRAEFHRLNFRTFSVTVLGNVRLRRQDCLHLTAGIQHCFEETA